MMAPTPLQMLKRLWDSQVMDEEQRMFNYRLLKAAGVFAGSALLMYNFGDMMTPEGIAEVLS
ncbi:mitochondrial import receptor subunit TOM5 homolog [Lolium rigidum]|uniref:mitochondrial import receptor subunit TOM5 homolog n=1 Tax=Lolium rigidum TaxID=89674 RepID=UPI001F5D02F9|nr:mitochondrial import receptor subunit TOM5 homolog [Lolium rigidum]